MRPKRNVLLYCAEAPAVERLAMVLEVRSLRMRVTAVASPEEFARAARKDVFDVVVVYRSKLGEAPLLSGLGCADSEVYRLLGGAHECVVVELMDGLPPREYSRARRLVSGRLPEATAEAIDAIETACARRRGPNPQKNAQWGFSLAADRMVA